VRDITEQKHAEEGLRESERKFRAIFDQTFQFIGLMTPDGTLMEANRTAMEFSGTKESDVIGKPFWETPWWTHSGELQEKLRAAVRDAAQGEFVRFEATHMAADGRLHYVDFSLKPVKDEAGHVILLIPEGRDITERKRAEEQLAVSIERFNIVAQATNDAVWDWDLETNNVWWNDAIYTVYGYQRDDIEKTTESWYTRLHPEDRERVVTGIHAVIDGGGQNWTDEFRFRKADSSYAYILDRGYIIHDTRGKAVRMVGAMLDITGRKQAEEALHLFKDLVEHSTDAIGMSTPEGRHYYQNKAFDRMFGGIGDIPPETVYVDKAIGKQVFDTIMGGGSWQGEVKMFRSDGTIMDILLSAYAIRNQDGRIIGLVGLHTDITEQKHTGDKIKASLDEKVLLLREIHHRVKNNLQIIISLVNLQMRQIDDERLKQVMAETQNRVRAMAFVHEKLYQSEDISHIDLANYTRFLVSHLFSFYGVDSRQVALNVDIGKIMLSIDTTIPLGLILNELISNALKHAFPNGRTGTLSITVREEDKALYLTIKDDGIGVPADFDWRNAETLGLRLVCSLVEQLDGTIELDRSVGTAFTIVVKEKE
ncbi:MAG: PAS domain S-box protein, partial [Methanoregula sp.]|nr:PAS domain S-box protein [Methanoregula sp.]